MSDILERIQRAIIGVTCCEALQKVDLLQAGDEIFIVAMLRVAVGPVLPDRRGYLFTFEAACSVDEGRKRLPRRGDGQGLVPKGCGNGDTQEGIGNLRDHEHWEKTESNGSKEWTRALTYEDRHLIDGDPRIFVRIP